MIAAAAAAWISLMVAGGLAAQESAEPEPGSVGVRAEISAWFCIPSGWLSITRGSKPGTATSMNVGDEFDLNRELEPAADLVVSLGPRHGVGARFRTITLSGEGADEDGFVYHGETFAAGRRVRAEASFLLLDVDYRFTFNPEDPFRVTGHLGAEYWNFDSRLKTVDGAVPAIDTSRGFDSAFWLLGVSASWSLSGSLELGAFLAGGTERSHQYFFEAGLRAALRVVDHVRVTGGYEFHTLHFRQSTNQSGMNFQGPTLGIEVGF